MKGYFQSSNNFSLTFRNTSIKSKISQQNSYVKNIPFTLTYFRYKEKIPKKNDINKEIKPIIKDNKKEIQKKKTLDNEKQKQKSKQLKIR